METEDNPRFDQSLIPRQRDSTVEVAPSLEARQDDEAAALTVAIEGLRNVAREVKVYRPGTETTESRHSADLNIPPADPEDETVFPQPRPGMMGGDLLG